MLGVGWWGATGKFHFSKKEKQKKRTLAFARGRLIRGSTSICLSFTGKGLVQSLWSFHFRFSVRCKKREKKRPLAITAKGRYQRGSTFVYQCFTATELRKSSINDCCCNGQTRSLLLFFRKNDSKMCFTTMRYLFAPTRDSLQTASLATLLFDVCFIKLCLTLLALKENVKHFFWNFRNFVACTDFEGKIQGKEDAAA